MDKPLKTPPPYPIAGIGHVLRAATILQMDGGATASRMAERLGVARSTAHRVLAMLVYRDFAVQGQDQVYRAGPVLELAAHSQSLVSRLRAAALPHLHRVVDLGVDDLLAWRRQVTPVGLSRISLIPRPMWVGTSGVDGWLQEAGAAARDLGRNVHVLCEHQSVADAALVWNLRALHG